MYYYLCIALLLLSLSASAQKKVLDHSVYDSWKSFGNISLTDDGKYSVCVVREQEGNDQILIRQLSSKKELVIPRGYHFSITADQKYVVALIKAPFADIRQAKIKKKPDEKMPKDSLAIISLNGFSITKIANVSEFKTGKDFSEYIAFTLSDTVKRDDKAQTLIVYRMATGEKDTIRNTVEYVFAKSGKTLAVAATPKEKDSTDFAKLWYIDLNKKYEKKMVAQKSAVYKHLALSESGNRLAFLATSDSVKKEIKEFKLYYYTSGADSAILLADKSKEGIPNQWGIGEYRAPEFSKNEQRLFLGIAPIAKPKDQSIPDFEKAQLDIWHWQDPLIQPQQLKELKQTQEKTYLSYFELDRPDRLYQLETEEIPDVQVSDENNGRYALGRSWLNYRIQSQWDSHARNTNDLWVFDLNEHTRKQIKTGLRAECHFSPLGNYLLWYLIEDAKYYGYSIQTEKEICLTDRIPVNFWNEKNDSPRDPDSYGIASWNGDETVLVYDAYDVWKLDPSGVKPPENITKGAGRQNNITLRYFRTDPESRYIKPKEKMMFTVLDNTTKERGFYEIDKSVLKPLIRDKYHFTIPVKAKNREVYAYTKSNFHTSPDLFVTDNGWKTETRLSDINPKMKEYNWGTAELVSWTTFDGKKIQGVLYKPEDFDPVRKYPVLVYFYERWTDQLYVHYPPVPSRSSIIFPYFCSRGYIVFIPDIYYTPGYPGKSAYNCIVSGVEELCKNPWVDKERIGIQGQSWGGYQTAYVITQTNIFAAAGAGAPVVNMYSAYGGIRWSTGISRQHQYEHSQSRIGNTIWESPELYRENSPLFFLDKMETPVLIMHNDNDGAVPWYQGIEYFMALRRLQKPAWLLQYNGEEHNLTQRRNSKDISIRYQQFFDHYLKGEPMPVWMKTGVPAVKKGVDYGFE